MKKTKLLGIIAVTAMIGLMVSACEGPMGPQGPQGPQGEQGYQGDQGGQGYQGQGIIWRGNYYNGEQPQYPQPGYAFFNTETGNAYIWAQNGGTGSFDWRVLGITLTKVPM